MSAFYKFDVETAPKTVKHSRKGDGNKENKRIRKPSEIKWKKLIEDLRDWMSTQDINLMYVNRIGWNGPRNRVLEEVMYRLQTSVKQLPLPGKVPLPEVAKQIEALRALMVKQDNKERERLKDDFVQTWNPEGTKCEVLEEAMRRLGGPVPMPSHDGLEGTPVAVQAVDETQVGERPLNKGRVEPLMANKGKKRGVNDIENIASKKSQGKKRKLDNSEDTASKKSQGKKRKVEDDEHTASKKRRTATTGHTMPETMAEFVQGSSSSGRIKTGGNYGVFSATPGANEYWEAPFTVKKPSPSTQPLLCGVDSGLPRTPSSEQEQALCNTYTSQPGPSSLEDEQAEQSDPQGQVGYAHKNKPLDHMSYPSSQTGDAGIDQEISAVMPHGQDRTSHDVIERGDEDEETQPETETTYDWSRDQDMFVQSMVDPPSNIDSEEMDERWNALMQDDTVLEWWGRMRVPEDMWDMTWSEMLKSEDGARWWNAM